MKELMHVIRDERSVKLLMRKMDEKIEMNRNVRAEEVREILRNELKKGKP